MVGDGVRINTHRRHHNLRRHLLIRSMVGDGVRTHECTLTSPLSIPHPRLPRQPYQPPPDKPDRARDREEDGRSDRLTLPGLRVSVLGRRGKLQALLASVPQSSTRRRRMPRKVESSSGEGAAEREAARCWNQNPSSLSLSLPPFSLAFVLFRGRANKTGETWRGRHRP
jgi:hypothetical protein